MTKDLPSPETLRKLLRYEPETGKLFWRERSAKWFSAGKRSPEQIAGTWNAKHAGSEALITPDAGGYLSGRIFGRFYLAHRVIWAMTAGEWPDGQIDHIDGVRANNIAENLRLVTASENAKNRKRHCTNTSGVSGVHKNTATGKWRAQTRCDGRLRHLGYFDSRCDAATARKAAEKDFGYHANHGRN